MKRRGRAVFLDRDGVIIRETNYLSDPARIQILRGVPEAMQALRAAGFRVVVVTNQSGVARGCFTLSRLREIHRELKRLLERRGARWDALYVSTHHPNARHPWRKPGIGMLEAARKRFGLDLKASYFVGDTTTDMQTARNAGCAAVLVRTGKGGRDGKYPGARPDRICRELASAARWILARDQASCPMGAVPSSR